MVFKIESKEQLIEHAKQCYEKAVEENLAMTGFYIQTHGVGIEFISGDMKAQGMANYLRGFGFDVKDNYETRSGAVVVLGEGLLVFANGYCTMIQDGDSLPQKVIVAEFSEELKEIGKIEIPITLSDKQLYYIVANDVSCRWLDWERDTKRSNGKEFNDGRNGLTYDIEWVTKLLIEGEELSFDSIEMEGAITKERLYDALKVKAKQSTCRNGKFDLHNLDDYDFDAIVQIAFFGEVVYG